MPAFEIFHLDPVQQAVGLAAVIGILATWLAQRLRVPGIILYCVAGLVFGASGLGWIDLGAGADGGTLGAYLSKVLPLLVAVIVYEGALTLEPEGFKQAPRAVLGLLHVGAATTFVLTWWGAWKLLGFPVGPAAVLGAVFVVTGPTVIQPILRRVRLRSGVDATLRWESILIDPIGAVLSVVVIEIVAHASGEAEWPMVVLSGIGSLVVGGVIGLGTADVSRRLIQDPRTQASREDDLNAVVLLGAMLGGFLLSEAILPESGLVAIVVAGLLAARSHFFGLHDVRQFKSLIATMVVSTIFVLLGSATETGWATLVDSRVLIFCAFLIFVVRPLAVLVATWRSNLAWSERGYLALLAPKGIVAAALASFAGAELGEAGATIDTVNRTQLGLGDTALAVITVCVLFYGLTSGPLAALLRVKEPKRTRLLIIGAGPFARALAHAAYDVGIDVSVVDTNRSLVRQAEVEGLNAYLENALDMDRLESLGLARAKHVVAMTPNDGVNALICRQFAEIVGPAGTWQLVTSTKSEGGQAAVQHGGRPAFLEGLQLTGVHYALEAKTLRVSVRRCPRSQEEPCKLSAGALPLLRVAVDGEWSVFGDGTEVTNFDPGEAIVCLETVEGVENPLVLALLRGSAGEPASRPE